MKVPKRNNDLVVTPREAATMLGIHLNTLKRIPAAELPYFTIATTPNRRDRRYHRDDVEEYIERNTVNG